MSILDTYKNWYDKNWCNKPSTIKESDKTWDNTYEYRFICNNCGHSNSCRITKGIRVDQCSSMKCTNCKCNQ